MPSRSPYFVGPVVDTALIGGLSILTALGFWALQASGHALPGPPLAAGLAWVVNWPHFSASSYRLYHTKANIAQYPVTALAIPALITMAVVGSFFAPTTAGAALIKLYLLWSPYHFSSQSLGITLIYARRAGLVIGRLERYVAAMFFFAGYFRLVFNQESATGVEQLGAIGYPLFGVPPWLAEGALGIQLIFGLGLLVLLARRGATSPIIFLPALTQLVWFEAGARIPQYNWLVPFFHSLQYLLIAWAMQLKERRNAVGAAPPARFVLRESLRWAALNVAGGAFLFLLLPGAARLAGVPAVAAVPILFAAVQIHHFFVDGVIWKLRNPRVGPSLLVDLRD